MPIGIFDSGIGGLGVFKKIRKLLPKEKVIYLADSANCPYWGKSDSQIKKIALNNAKFLLKKGCNVIVIACNTASTIALEYIRLRTKIATSLFTLRKCKCGSGGIIPIVGVVPVVKTAASISKNKKIGILATKKTVESKYLKDLINQFCSIEEGFKVYYHAANQLVELVESGIMNYESGKLKMKNEKCKITAKNVKFYSSTRMKFGGEKIQNSSRPASRQGGQARIIIYRYLIPFIKAKVDVIVLGCTHFPFLRPEIEKIMGPNVKILDSNGAVARQVGRIVESSKYRVESIKKPKYQFFTTGDINRLKLVVESFLKLENPRIYKKS